MVLSEEEKGVELAPSATPAESGDAPGVTTEELVTDDGVVVDRSDHPISRRSIPENVLKVLYRLHRSGYRAYLCGGSVRDLLINRQPKDFDIATDAHPTEIRRLFRNSRIIGRRFRLAHIMFQDMIVEVSTFRREPERGTEENAELLVTDDNTFGTPLQDARRRDFTINGLFYNIADFSVIDYVGGLDDMDGRQVRVIGDPDLRFREDPVRMLRAIEFASRLDFAIEKETYEGLLRHRNEILKASAPRVSEEILELLRRGWSRDAMRLLVETALLEPLLPEIFHAISVDRAPYFWKMLEVVDRTVQAGRKISDAVLLSVLLLPWIMEELEKEGARREQKMRIAEVILFIRDLIQPACARMALAAGTRHQIETALETLWRLLEPPVDKKAQFRFVFREPFSDALALLELYALSSGRYVDQYRQWHSFAQRVRRSTEETPPPTRRRKRRR
ncbi:MAG: polynucleotide adenylyltransferase PcnB [Thermoanaerobaculia bacterium]|nr:polynucleotide adenylyltransferase PcnB [Thermoanaerobaculia bacterium]